MENTMKTEYLDGNEYFPAKLRCEDEHGNRGEVSFPRHVKRWGSSTGRWEDADVDMLTHCEGNAEETILAGEFAAELGRMAKVLDLAFAGEAEAHKEREAKEKAEEEFQGKAADLAQQMRCLELAQYYMQLVRVQREGHSSNAKGELVVSMVKDDDSDTERIQPRMYLKESNGNHWDFRATQVAKFEVKDGSKYTKIKLTPMEDLVSQAYKQLEEETAHATSDV
jgi:hypothetical protein